VDAYIAAAHKIQILEIPSSRRLFPRWPSISTPRFLEPMTAQRVSHVHVLRILLAIGPTETSHFQTWHEKAGNAIVSKQTIVDPSPMFLCFSRT
jgi:hypothetical protein